MILTANYNDCGLKLCLLVANIFTHIFLAPCIKCEVIGYAVIDTRNEGRNFDFAQMISDDIHEELCHFHIFMRANALFFVSSRWTKMGRF